MNLIPESAVKSCWLHYYTAHLHAEFIPDPETELKFVRATKDGMRIVLLPNGTTYKLTKSHVSFLSPDKQRQADEDFARGVGG